MADQAERIILEAEDQVTPVVGQANAGLDSFEKKAESSHGKVIRISDQTRSSVQRLIASQLQPKLPVEGFENCHRAARVRCRCPLSAWAAEESRSLGSETQDEVKAAL